MRSGTPLLYRIDLHVEVAAVSPADLALASAVKGSAVKGIHIVETFNYYAVSSARPATSRI